MKNLVFNGMMVTAFLLSVTGCNNDDKDKLPKGDAITRISTGISTKAVDTNWEDGDAIGLFMYETDSTTLVDGQFNYEYTNSVDGPIGIFNPASQAQTLYFPQNGNSILLKGYYPYRSGITSDMSIAFDVTDQTVLQTIDLMTSEHISGFSKTDSDVQLHFYHRMSKLIFDLSAEDATDQIDFSRLALTITGMYGGNTYDLAADDFLTRYTPEADIEVPLRTDENENQRTAIVLPRMAGPDVTFEFTTLTGDTYYATMSDTLELKSGNQYTFRIILSKNPVTVTADIEPWIPNDAGQYEAK